MLTLQQKLVTRASQKLLRPFRTKREIYLTESLLEYVIYYHLLSLPNIALIYNRRNIIILYFLVFVDLSFSLGFLLYIIDLVNKFTSTFSTDTPLCNHFHSKV